MERTAMSQPNQNAHPDPSELPTPPSGFPMQINRRPSRAPLWFGITVFMAVAAVAVVLAVTLTNGDVDQKGRTPGNGFVGVTSATITLTGSMTLFDTDLQSYGGGCSGRGGYSDIAEGASVTIYDDAGKIVGAGHLGHSSMSSSGGCTFDFSVDVPDGKPFYQVEVTHRGKVTYPAADVKAGTVELSLGS
jgi:hypothetical protein